MFGRSAIRIVTCMHDAPPRTRPVQAHVQPLRPSSSTTPRAAVLTASDVVHGYGKQTVLHGINVTINAGDTVALTGPSGSGKTTLLHLLAGIDTPWDGQIHLAARQTSGPVSSPLDRGGDITKLGTEQRSTLRRSRFGLMFQSGQLLDELTCEENVALPLIAGGMELREARAAARTLFPTLGLDGLEDRRPGEVSGGQRQRIALARALVTQPDVLFADEPTGALDSRTGAMLMDTLLAAQQNTGMALVLVTHDRDIAARCRRVLALSDGRFLDPNAATAPASAATASVTDRRRG